MDETTTAPAAPENEAPVAAPEAGEEAATPETPETPAAEPAAE